MEVNGGPSFKVDGDRVVVTDKNHTVEISDTEVEPTLTIVPATAVSKYEKKT
jgi:hypothetical protein